MVVSEKVEKGGPMCALRRIHPLVRRPKEGAARDFGGECVPRFEISHRMTYKCI